MFVCMNLMENFNNMYHKFSLSVTYLISGEEKRNILKETVLDTLLKIALFKFKKEKRT